MGRTQFATSLSLPRPKLLVQPFSDRPVVFDDGCVSPRRRQLWRINVEAARIRASLRATGTVAWPTAPPGKRSKSAGIPQKARPDRCRTGAARPTEKRHFLIVRGLSNCFSLPSRTSRFSRIRDFLGFIVCTWELDFSGCGSSHACFLACFVINVRFFHGC